MEKMGNVKKMRIMLTAVGEFRVKDCGSDDDDDDDDDDDGGDDVAPIQISQSCSPLPTSSLLQCSPFSSMADGSISILYPSRVEGDVSGGYAKGRTQGGAHL